MPVIAGELGYPMERSFSMKTSFHSVLAPDIESFIDLKRSLGYKYNCEEYILHRFDVYWENRNGSSDVVTMEALSGWVKQLPTEGKSSQYARIHTVKQLMLFRNSLGKHSYVPMDKIKVPKRPVIHVLSEYEIQELFTKIDSFRPKRPTSETLRISKEYPVLFRLILTTGLRRSEAVSIQISELHIKERTIEIRNAKGHKERIISISEDMAFLLENYCRFIKSMVSVQDKWLFPAVNPAFHLSSGALGDRFNRFWNQTPCAANCSGKPTIHALRHTFVVIRINTWLKNGIDTSVMLPYLSRHLGHKSMNETFYYYHQVLESLDFIRQKDSISALVLPEVRIR